MGAPDLLVAARRKFLASDEYTYAAAADEIGEFEDGSPWVFASLDPETGLPFAYGPDQASVTFYLRANDWNRTENTARSPRLGVVVFVEGSDRSSPDAEWLARDVAEAVIQAFDDPHSVKLNTWPGVRVFYTRWSGELSVGDVENMPTSYRADLDFEIGLC